MRRGKSRAKKEQLRRRTLTLAPLLARRASWAPADHLSEQKADTTQRGGETDGVRSSGQGGTCRGSSRAVREEAESARNSVLDDGLRADQAQEDARIGQKVEDRALARRCVLPSHSANQLDVQTGLRRYPAPSLLRASSV